MNEAPAGGAGSVSLGRSGAQERVTGAQERFSALFQDLFGGAGQGPASASRIWLGIQGIVWSGAEASAGEQLSAGANAARSAAATFGAGEFNMLGLVPFGMTPNHTSGI